jgi:deoxyribodipyrimidine photolyase-related protein
LATTTKPLHDRARRQRTATKPYPAGGSYISRMSDFCGSCRYRPHLRTGPQACPVTTGYWSFVAGHRSPLADPRTARAVAGLERLSDVKELLAVDRRRGDAPP